MAASSSTIRWCAVSLLALLVSGCVIGDQLTTFTIQPDGSADFVVFRSNLRSTEKGEKGANELADYKARFDARTDDELARVAEAGGAAVEASWLRGQVPFSNLVRARFPNSAALEKFLTIKKADGSFLVKTRFTSDGARRKLTVRLALAAADGPPESPSSSVEQIRQALANGISETRVAFVSGTITAAHGFTIAGDKQSALLDAAAIGGIVRAGGKGELYLEWEVTP